MPIAAGVNTNISPLTLDNRRKRAVFSRSPGRYSALAAHYRNSRRVGSIPDVATGKRTVSLLVNGGSELADTRRQGGSNPAPGCSRIRSTTSDRGYNFDTNPPAGAVSEQDAGIVTGLDYNF